MRHIAIVLLALSLAACGGGGDEEEDPTQPTEKIADPAPAVQHPGR